MDRIDVKGMVREAVGGEWEGFCIRHPALSRVVSRELIVEQYAADLRGEPDFIEAMRNVELAGLAHSALQELAQKLVTGWLRVL